MSSQYPGDRNLTVDRLRTLLAYDPSTGFFRWKVRRGGYALPGSVAGSPNSEGYVQIRVDRVLHKAHRLAWLYMTGEWPKDFIDHIDRDPSNNTWSNLRSATNAENVRNQNRRANNSSGVPGVNWNGYSWTVRVGAAMQRIYIGRFKSFSAAVAARDAAVKRLHGQFAAGFDHDAR